MPEAVHGTIGFFETESVSAPSLGNGWEFQNGGGENRAWTRDNDLGKSGDELQSALHDEKVTTSFTYVFKQPSTPVTHYTWPKIGQVSGGWLFDNFSVAWSRDKLAAVLTLNCHRHGSGNHEQGRTYTPSLAAIAVPSFGVPSSFGSAFALASGAVVDLRSATYTVGVTHVDETGRSGGHLKGDSHDGVETLAVELTGAATADDYTTSWDKTGAARTPSNTGVTTSSLSFEHHLQHDVDEE